MSKLNFNLKIMRPVLCLLIPVFLLATILSSSNSYAADNTMETKAFNVTVDVAQDNTCWITETITMNYLSPHHGIYRNIRYAGTAESEYNGQVYQQNYRNQIENISVEGYPFQVYTEGDYYVIQIGSGDYYVEGEHTYKITYQCILRDDRIGEFDSFYWNVVPFGWSTPIESSHVVVNMPKSVSADQVEFIRGAYGSIDAIGFQTADSGKSFAIMENGLADGEGITFRAVLEEGYFVGEKNYTWALWGLVTANIIAALTALILWSKLGRDPKIVQTVEFYPPEGTTPAEAGYILDGVIDKKDLVSLVIYLADKGYLNIEQGVDNNDFILHKANDLPENAKVYLKTFFEGLFQDAEGEPLQSVHVSDLKGTFHHSYTAALGELNGYFTLRKENAIFKQNSIIARIAGIGLLIVPLLATIVLGAIYQAMDFASIFVIPSIISAIIGFSIIARIYDKRDDGKRVTAVAGTIVGAIFSVLGIFIAVFLCSYLHLPLYVPIIMVVSYVCCFVFVLIMKSRTRKGAELMGKILGFKQFIKSAEVDRIRILVDENPQYFYKILPYAYVFGLTDQWSKHFEGIAMEPPEWYASNNLGTGLFNVMLINSMLHNTTTALESSLIPASNLRDGSGSGLGGSGGGGFSGGGFGGGGMGGGGGGGW